MIQLPPPPIQDIKDWPFSLQEWFRKVFQSLTNAGNGGIGFTQLDFTGSNLTSILTRNHNDLQNKQGGSGTSFYHLSAVLNSSKTVTFGSILSLNSTSTTQTVTGAIVGDSVVITPSSNIEPGINIFGYVSAPDTVTITANNNSAGSISVANRTYNILVLRA